MKKSDFYNRNLQSLIVSRNKFKFIKFESH